MAKSSTQTHDSLFDVTKIKADAARSLDRGAVTEDYALDVNAACSLLNMALATEIVCVLRYRHHQIIARGIDSKEIAEEFEEHAKNEEKHMLWLAERIDQLGGDPDMNPATVGARAATDYGSAQDLISMLKDDLIGERVVIEVYRSMVQWFGIKDSTTRRILERILEDEEEHANDLANLLSTSERSGRAASVEGPQASH